MNTSSSSIQHVSDTSYWMAAYRAMESERKDALFHDHYAKLLVGDYGNQISQSMKSVARYAYWTLVIRTRLIDDYILKYVNQGYTTIISLGAGLDTRPYRLNVPSATRWIEIDFPDLIELKKRKLEGIKPLCALEWIGFDLENRQERQRIFADLNRSIGPAIILTEGVIPYLTESVVSDLANDLYLHPNFKLWVAEYYSPLVYPRYQTEAFKKSLGRAPFQFFPADWFAFFEKSGWVKKEMDYLYDEGERLGRKFPLPWWVNLLMYVAPKEKIIQNARVSAYMVFEKK
ncbi:MAG: SAM-dependent methyltransferase [Pseudomonadota bacterium]